MTKEKNMKLTNVCNEIIDILNNRDLTFGEGLIILLELKRLLEKQYNCS